MKMPLFSDDSSVYKPKSMSIGGRIVKNSRRVGTKT